MLYLSGIIGLLAFALLFFTIGRALGAIKAASNTETKSKLYIELTKALLSWQVISGGLVTGFIVNFSEEIARFLN